MQISSWIQSVRPHAHLTLALPVLLGELAGGLATNPNWVWFAVAHGFTLLDHVLIVWVNDLADEPFDRAQRHPTWISGGSRVLVLGRISREMLTRGAWVVAVLVMLLGGYAAGSGRPWAPAFFAAAIGILLAYSWPFACPVSEDSGHQAGNWRGLSYAGHGEWLQAFGVGVLLPGLGFCLQAGSLWGFPWWALPPSTALALASHLATALPDTESDRIANKRTHSVRYGEGQSLAVAVASVAFGSCTVTLVNWSVGGLSLLPLSGLTPLLLLTLARSRLQQSLAILLSVLGIFSAWCLLTAVTAAP